MTFELAVKLNKNIIDHLSSISFSTRWQHESSILYIGIHNFRNTFMRMLCLVMAKFIVHLSVKLIMTFCQTVNFIMHLSVFCKPLCKLNFISMYIYIYVFLQSWWLKLSYLYTRFSWSIGFKFKHYKSIQNHKRLPIQV